MSANDVPGGGGNEKKTGMRRSRKSSKSGPPAPPTEDIVAPGEQIEEDPYYEQDSNSPIPAEDNSEDLPLDIPGSRKVSEDQSCSTNVTLPKSVPTKFVSDNPFKIKPESKKKLQQPNRELSKDEDIFEETDLEPSKKHHAGTRTATSAQHGKKVINLNTRTRSRIAEIRNLWKERESRASQARGTMLGTPSPAPKVKLIHGAEPVSSRLEKWEERTEKRVSGLGGKGSLTSALPGNKTKFAGFTTVAIGSEESSKTSTPKKFNVSKQPPFKDQKSTSPSKSAGITAKLRTPIKGLEKISEPPDVVGEQPLTVSAISSSGKSPMVNVAKLGVRLPMFPMTRMPLSSATVPPPTKVAIPPPTSNITGENVPVNLMTKSSQPISATAETKEVQVKAGSLLPTLSSKISSIGVKIPVLPPPGGSAFPFRPPVTGQPLTVKQIKELKAKELLESKSSQLLPGFDSDTDSLFQLPPTIMASISDTSAANIKKTNVPKVSAGIANVNQWGALSGAVAQLALKKTVKVEEKAALPVEDKEQQPIPIIDKSKKILQPSEATKSNKVPMLPPTLPQQKEILNVDENSGLSGDDILLIQRSPTPMTMEEFEKDDVEPEVPDQLSEKGDEDMSPEGTLDTMDSVILREELPLLELHSMLEGIAKPKPQNRRPTSKRK